MVFDLLTNMVAPTALGGALTGCNSAKGGRGCFLPLITNRRAVGKMWARNVNARKWLPSVFLPPRLTNTKLKPQPAPCWWRLFGVALIPGAAKPHVPPPCATACTRRDTWKQSKENDTSREARVVARSKGGSADKIPSIPSCETEWKKYSKKRCRGKIMTFKFLRQHRRNYGGGRNVECGLNAFEAWMGAARSSRSCQAGFFESRPARCFVDKPMAGSPRTWEDFFPGAGPEKRRVPICHFQFRLHYSALCQRQPRLGSKNVLDWQRNVRGKPLACEL